MTLTTEQLRARAAAYRTDAETLAELGDTASSQRLNESANAFDELAANREAQPVLYASEETLAYAKEGEKSLVTWSEPMGDAVIPLYTAPPAPAVVSGRNAEVWMAEALLQKKVAEDLRKSVTAVPKEMTIEQSYENVQTWHYANGWNACRAAMLAQLVSSGYKLPEGFKLMPLEMTDEIGEAIAMEARCCGGIALCIYEAALAAAPEGGK